MRVMLDNSIPGHSQLCDWAMGPQGPLFGVQNQHCEVLGMVRKKPHDDAAFQSQIDSLFTVGRLIREKRIEAFTYSELRCEQMEQFSGDSMLDALAECNIQTCPPAIDRSRFLQGDYFAFARKGGKADRKRGLSTGLSQIAFLQMLCGLEDGFLSQWIPAKDILGLTEFEIESLQNLRCFQQFCKISNSVENYPDMFHLWTAQRNRMQVFLTLDNRLANIAKAIHKSQGVAIEFPTQVLRPSELLRLLGVEAPDPVPIKRGQFYTLLELRRDAPTERFALFRVRRR
jgi:hypothetical protein